MENDFDQADYTTVGVASPVYNGTSITLSGGTSQLSNYIRYNPIVTSRNNLKITIRYTADVFNSTSYGVAIKIVGINATSTKFNNGFAIATSNNAEKGKLYFWGTGGNGTDGVPYTTSGASALPVNLNDTMELVVVQNNLGFVITGYNLTVDPTRSSPVTLNYQMLTSLPFINGVYHNTAKLALMAWGGTQTINYFKVETAEYENCDLLIIGDSKTQGYGAATVTNRFGSLWETNNPTKKIHICSGTSDHTAEFLATINEFKQYKAKKAILFIGRNDIQTSVPAGTWQANYSSIVSQLRSVGTDVWHQLPTSESVLNQSALTTWITNTYPTRLISDPTAASGADCDDGIHPNATGHTKIYNNQAATISI